MVGVPAALAGADVILDPQTARHCVVRPLARPEQEGGLLALDVRSRHSGPTTGPQISRSRARHAAGSLAGFFFTLRVFFSEMIHAQAFRIRRVDRKF